MEPAAPHGSSIWTQGPKHVGCILLLSWVMIRELDWMWNSREANVAGSDLVCCVPLCQSQDQYFLISVAHVWCRGQPLPSSSSNTHEASSLYLPSLQLLQNTLVT